MSDEPRTVEGFLFICPGVPGVACDLRKGHTGEHRSWIGGSPVSPDEPRELSLGDFVFTVAASIPVAAKHHPECQRTTDATWCVCQLRAPGGPGESLVVCPDKQTKDVVVAVLAEVARLEAGDDSAGDTTPYDLCIWAAAEEIRTAMRLSRESVP